MEHSLLRQLNQLCEFPLLAALTSSFAFPLEVIEMLRPNHPCTLTDPLIHKETAAIAPMKMRRAGGGAVVLNGYLYAIGNFCSHIFKRL